MSTAQVHFVITADLEVDAKKLLEAILAAATPKAIVQIKFGPVSEQEEQK